MNAPTWWTGTSGFAYKQWKGSFYPADAKDADLLLHYGRKLASVEVNSTFYRMPRAAVLERWMEMVPTEFRFVLKASRRITHQSRLVDCQDSVDYLWKQVQVLGARLGPILFQLPPGFRANRERLQAFARSLPEGMRAAFEFRHESWNRPEIHEVLRERDYAVCVGDDDDGGGEVVSTASWGYLRLRREAYSRAELRAWLDAAEGQGWREVFCYFKHEDGPTGPEMAGQMFELARAGPPGVKLR